MKKIFPASLLVLMFMTILTFAPPRTKESRAANKPTGGALADGMLVINEDNSHFFGSRTPQQMNLDGLNAFVDQYAGTKVTHLFLCPNAMRANFRSKSRDAIWAPVNGKEPEGRWPQNAKLLQKQGIDPYVVWIARCREKNISPWISMRMNDIHSVNEPDNFMHSTFWRKNPQFRRVPQDPKTWQDRAFDYSYPEVRQFQMAFVRELLQRYDMDGLELDWMRFGWHLTPGKEKEQAPILTEFVRDVRRLTDAWGKKRGHKIALAVRTPAVPEHAAALGMDAVTWAKEGLVDMIVPCPFWTTSDFDIPVEQWLKELGSAAEGVKVVPGMELGVRSKPDATSVRADLPMLYGFVEAERQRGAKSLYLFNWMDSQTIPVSQEQYRTLLEKGVGPKVTSAAMRRFPVTFHDTVPKGSSNGAQLPQSTLPGATFVVYTGEKPTAGNVTVVAALKLGQSTTLRATLNGHESTAQKVCDAPEKIGGVYKLALMFSFPREALVSGKNTVTLASSDGKNDQIVWLEIRVTP